MTTTVSSFQSYAIDAKHSSVEFVVRHLMITKVRGRFSSVNGLITLAADSDLPASVQATIDVGSIDTREEQRDAHLKSPEFFHAGQHPTLSFTSTSIAGHGPDFTIAGNLMIAGVTKPVTLEATFEGRAKDPWGGDRIGYTATTKINREDFGLTYNQALETGGVMIGKDVTIELQIQAVRQ